MLMAEVSGLTLGFSDVIPCVQAARGDGAKDWFSAPLNDVG